MIYHRESGLWVPERKRITRVPLIRRPSRGKVPAVVPGADIIGDLFWRLANPTFGNTNTVNGTGPTATLPYIGNLVVGSTLVGCLYSGQGSGRTIAMSDSVNGSWTKIKQQDLTTDGDSFGLFYFPNNASNGAPTVTLTDTGSSSSLRGLIAELQNVTATPLDQNAGQDQASTNAPSSGNITTAWTITIVVAVTANDGVQGSETITAGTGFTEGTKLNTGTQDRLSMIYKVLTSTSTLDGKFSSNKTEEYATIVADFKGSDGAAGGGGGLFSQNSLEGIGRVGKNFYPGTGPSSYNRKAA